MEDTKKEFKSLRRDVRALANGSYWEGKRIRNGLEELGKIIRFNELKEEHE